jgi:hypothetical protein
MSEHEVDPLTITDAIQQENTNAVSKIRALFVEPGFPANRAEDAGVAEPSEKMKDGAP